MVGGSVGRLQVVGGSVAGGFNKPHAKKANLLNWSFDKIKTELGFRCHGPAIVNVISVTLMQQSGKEKQLILKTKPIALAQQIFLKNIFLHSANFSLLGLQGP